MLPIVTYIDLETTGASVSQDRITEIALIRHENGKEVARWQSLVNPQTPIPSFIQAITGITDLMVKNAPIFEEVAAELSRYIDGSVLVAHNANFDCGFISQEYKRLGRQIIPKKMCTVRLSRELYPEHKHHSLDALIDRFGLRVTQRHRAMADVEIMMAFIKATEQDLGKEKLEITAQALVSS